VQAYACSVPVAWLDYSEVVAQAAGMVSVQADCTLDEAFERMENVAVPMSQTIEQIALAVIERRLRFSRPD
jgi:AmiR/NasT family two-component response regulator